MHEDKVLLWPCRHTLHHIACYSHTYNVSCPLLCTLAQIHSNNMKVCASKSFHCHFIVVRRVFYGCLQHVDANHVSFASHTSTKKSVYYVERKKGARRENRCLIILQCCCLFIYSFDQVKSSFDVQILILKISVEREREKRPVHQPWTNKQTIDLVIDIIYGQIFFCRWAIRIADQNCRFFFVSLSICFSWKYAAYRIEIEEIFEIDFLWKNSFATRY